MACEKLNLHLLGGGDKISECIPKSSKLDWDSTYNLKLKSYKFGGC